MKKLLLLSIYLIINSYFCAQSFTLNISYNGSGSGQIEVDGVLYSLPFSSNYNQGSKVEIKAVPANGSNFSYWTGDLSGSNNPVEININGNKTITAVFSIIKYTLAIDRSGNGSGQVKVDGELYNLPFSKEFNSGSQVNIEAAAGTGSYFEYWSGDQIGSINPVSITMYNNKTITVNYKLYEYYLNLDKSGSGNGKIKVNDAVQNTPYIKLFNYGAQVKLEAVPDQGNYFISWEGDLTTITNPSTITISGGKNITANFSITPQYSLQINPGGNGSGKIKIEGIVYLLPFSGTFFSGQEITMEAMPDAGSSFHDWSGDLNNNTNPYTLVIDGNKNITSNFSLNQQILNITKIGNGNGQVKVNNVLQTLPFHGTYNYNSQVNLEAVPDGGSIFMRWGEDLIDSNNPVSILMNKDMNISTVFNIDTQDKIELISPVDKLSSVPINVIFICNQNPKVTNYLFQLSKYNTFDTVYNIGNITIPPIMLQIGGLEYKTKYFWRVIGSDNSGNEIISDVWSFTTVNKPINGPTNLVAIPMENNGIFLSWKDNSENEQNFVIIKKTGDSLSTNEYQVIKTVEAGLTSYLDVNINLGLTYTYKVFASNSDTVSCTSNPACAKVLSSVFESSIPKQFGLSQNYPNPFNPETLISYQLPVGSHIKLDIYDLLGNKIGNIVDEYKQPGEYQTVFNGQNLSSGVYIYKLTAGEFTSVKKLILMK